MQVVSVMGAGTGFEYKWPSGDVELYRTWVEYKALAQDREHRIRVGFGTRQVYDQERVRVVVWIDGYPHAEFFGADDFDASGEVLSEIRVAGDVGEPMCRYGRDPIPERYIMFSAVGLSTRVNTGRVHSAWAVVANVSDHKTMIALAALRRRERMH